MNRELLEKEFNIVHLSTGDILREAVRDNTGLGKEARSFMDKGELVPDEIMVDLIAEKLESRGSRQGYLLDGFPRTLVQAEKLDRMLSALKSQVDLAMRMDLPEEILVKRLSGRLVCVICGANFNVFFEPPHQEEICDKCGGRLEKRKDDQVDVVQNRIRVYKKQSEPVENYYRKQGKLTEVDASGSVEDVTGQIRRAVAKFVQSL